MRFKKNGVTIISPLKQSLNKVTILITPADTALCKHFVNILMIELKNRGNKKMTDIALNFMNSQTQDMDSLAQHPVLLACQEYIVQQQHQRVSSKRALTKRLNKTSHLIREFHKLNTLFEFIGSIEMEQMATERDPFDFDESFNQFETTVAEYQVVLSQLRDIRTDTLTSLSKAKGPDLTLIE